MVRNHDLLFLARQWEVVDLPKSKKYLLRYFKTSLQLAFLKYIYVFGEYTNFVEHTGLRITQEWIVELWSRFEKLEKLNQEARANMDMALLAKIEAGKYKL